MTDRLRAIPLGLRYMAAAAFFFSVMSLLVKVAGQRLPSQEVVLGRAVVGAALSYAWLRRRGVAVRGNDRKLLLLRALFGFGALSAFFYALVHLPLADATVIQYTNPVFAALIAAWVLQERLGRWELAFVLASLGGVVLIARPSFMFGRATSELPPFAVAVALAGALLSACAYVTVRKLRVSEDPLVIVFWFALVSTVLSIPVVAPVAVWPTPGEWLALLGIGVATQIAQVCMTRGLHLERAGRATAVGYLQIIFAGIWGALFFAEYPDAWSIAGALVVVGSTFALAKQRREPAEPGGS